MLKIFLLTFCFFCSNLNLYADEDYQIVYSKVPALSYKSKPNDINFIEETEFMQREDTLNYDNNIKEARAIEQVLKPGVQFAEKPMIICRDHNCTNINNKITRTFLFNTLTSIFMTNTNSRLFLCEADPFSRSCLQSGISMPARIGIANAFVKIPKATINQVDLTRGLSKVSIGINYEVLVNGINKQCEPSIIDLIVPINYQAVLLNREFSCNMTSDGMTNLSFMINIDYIDLDYGLIGGYYSLGLQGSSIGGGTGYVLFKTEYTTRGLKFKAGGSTSGIDENTELNLQNIKPGEYFVEPLNEK